MEKKIKNGIKKLLESSENETTALIKAAVRQKFSARRAHSTQSERAQISNSVIETKSLEK